MYDNPEAAIADIVSNIDFDFEGDVLKARKVLSATAYLLAARPSSLSQVGASLGFDVGSIRELHEAARQFLKHRKSRYYKRSLLSRFRGGDF